jgi:acetyl-CoA C-acetyltransferase
LTRTFITGYGFTKIYRFYERSLEDLAFEAMTKAMDKAGSPGIDAIVVSNSFSPVLQSQNMLASLLAEDYGLRNIMVYNVENGSAGGITAADFGKRLIESNVANNVLVVGIEKLSDYNTDVMYRILSQLTNNDYEGFYGGNLLSQYALIADAYMKKYGVNEELLAEWPVLMHENASLTKHAQLRFKISREKVLSSDYASKPLRIMHLPPMSDGGAAIILSSDNLAEQKERLAELRETIILNDYFEITLKNDPTVIEGLKTLSSLLQRRGVLMNNIDVVDVTDHYSIGGPLILESLGIVERGKTLKNISEGGLRMGDKIVVNPTGGLKARGFPIGATGVYQLAELAGIIAGDDITGSRSSAEKALAISVGGVGAVLAGAYLEKA